MIRTIDDSVDFGRGFFNWQRRQFGDQKLNQWKTVMTDDRMILIKRITDRMKARDGQIDTSIWEDLNKKELSELKAIDAHKFPPTINSLFSRVIEEHLAK